MASFNWYTLSAYTVLQFEYLKTESKKFQVESGLRNEIIVMGKTKVVFKGRVKRNNGQIFPIINF